MIFLKIVATRKRASTVKVALEEALKEINQELSQIDGKIVKMSADAKALGGVEISIVVDGNEPYTKKIVGVNESATNAELSIKKAQEKINSIISEMNGEIADFYTKTIITPIGRAYTTMILATNERFSRPLGELNAEERRRQMQ